MSSVNKWNCGLTISVTTGSDGALVAKDDLFALHRAFAAREIFLEQSLSLVDSETPKSTRNLSHAASYTPFSASNQLFSNRKHSYISTSLLVNCRG